MVSGSTFSHIYAVGVSFNSTTSDVCAAQDDEAEPPRKRAMSGYELWRQTYLDSIVVRRVHLQPWNVNKRRRAQWWGGATEIVHGFISWLRARGKPLFGSMEARTCHHACASSMTLRASSPQGRQLRELPRLHEVTGFPRLCLTPDEGWNGLSQGKKAKKCPTLSAG